MPKSKRDLCNFLLPAQIYKLKPKKLLAHLFAIEPDKDYLRLCLIKKQHQAEPFIIGVLKKEKHAQVLLDLLDSYIEQETAEIISFLSVQGADGFTAGHWVAHERDEHTKFQFLMLLLKIATTSPQQVIDLLNIRAKSGATIFSLMLQRTPLIIKQLLELLSQITVNNPSLLFMLFKENEDAIHYFVKHSTNETKMQFLILMTQMAPAHPEQVIYLLSIKKSAESRVGVFLSAANKMVVKQFIALMMQLVKTKRIELLGFLAMSDPHYFEIGRILADERDPEIQAQFASLLTEIINVDVEDLLESSVFDYFWIMKSQDPTMNQLVLTILTTVAQQKPERVIALLSKKCQGKDQSIATGLFKNLSIGLLPSFLALLAILSPKAPLKVLALLTELKLDTMVHNQYYKNTTMTLLFYNLLSQIASTNTIEVLSFLEQEFKKGSAFFAKYPFCSEFNSNQPLLNLSHSTAQTHPAQVLSLFYTTNKKGETLGQWIVEQYDIATLNAFLNLLKTLADINLPEVMNYIHHKSKFAKNISHYIAERKCPELHTSFIKWIATIAQTKSKDILALIGLTDNEGQSFCSRLLADKNSKVISSLFDLIDALAKKRPLMTLVLIDKIMTVHHLGACGSGQTFQRLLKIISKIAVKHPTNTTQLFAKALLQTESLSRSLAASEGSQFLSLLMQLAPNNCCDVLAILNHSFINMGRNDTDQETALLGDLIDLLSVEMDVNPTGVLKALSQYHFTKTNPCFYLLTHGDEMVKQNLLALLQKGATTNPSDVLQLINRTRDGEISLLTEIVNPFNAELMLQYAQLLDLLGNEDLIKTCLAYCKKNSVSKNMVDFATSDPLSELRIAIAQTALTTGSTLNAIVRQLTKKEPDSTLGRIVHFFTDRPLQRLRAILPQPHPPIDNEVEGKNEVELLMSKGHLYPIKTLEPVTSMTDELAYPIELSVKIATDFSLI